MFTLTVRKIIDAAHQLPDSEHLITKACARPHGHSYFFDINITADDNTRSGMVVDFKAIKDIIEIFDHRNINEEFLKMNYDLPSTAENIAKVIHKEIYKRFPDLYNVEVGVCEGYKGQEQSSWVYYD